MSVLTVGHGTASEAALLALLQSAGVQSVIDVRRYPGSLEQTALAFPLVCGPGDSQ